MWPGAEVAVLLRGQDLRHLVLLVGLCSSPLTALTREVESTGHPSHLFCSAISRETEAEHRAGLLTDSTSLACNREVPSLLEVSTQ